MDQELRDLTDSVRRALKNAGWDTAHVDPEGDGTTIVIYDEASSHEIALSLEWA
jgi:hypothetical protein